jgi:hypothetical protein
MGLGVEFDPYDTYTPSQADWARTFARLDFMRPGFFRVVEPASDYFKGYDSSHNPTYRWKSQHVKELLTILAYAQSRGISVVLGDWGNPMINGDVRIPVDFLKQLRDTYGFTNIHYYNLINEPNGQAGCDFTCWTGMVKTLASGLTQVGGVQLVGPDNANSWDDTEAAYRLDTTVGLDADNPLGGDSWVTQTLNATPAQIGAYDSHRYATIWGIEHGIYGDQMRSRREQISNSDSPRKPYFAGEVGMTARQVSPFALHVTNRSELDALIDPSARTSASAFVDSQPHIKQFAYGVWMGDMMIQAIDAGISGASAWDLDDAMHVGGQYGSQNLKQWGFWNSLGGHDGYPSSDLNLRPWYYTWSLLARSFPAGSEPLAVPSTGIPGLRVAAAKIALGHRYAVSIAIVNDSSAASAINVAVPSARQRTTLARYDYFAGDRPADANGFPVPVALIRNARLARGVRVVLPSRGLVVLTTVAPIALTEGTHELVDELDDWRKVASHSKGFEFDHGIPARFNNDRSRVVSRTGKAQDLVYGARHITSFELKTYYKKSLELHVYRSKNGRRWTPVPLASTTSAPALGGHGRFLTELFPSAALPSNTNRLELVLAGRSTELGQVVIEYR